MKTAIRTICPIFNTSRMVQEYCDRFYLPCTVRRNELRASKRHRCHELAQWKSRVRASWKNVSFTNVESGPTDGLSYGSSLQVAAELYLNELTDADVIVEIYYGDVDPLGRMPTGKTIAMDCSRKLPNNTYRFEGSILCDKTGQQAFMVRVIPSHPDLAQKHEMALIQWA